MKLAIMQPYFFPYIGYYQLAYSVDRFLFYDDVNFIKKGYINRNCILSSAKELHFSLSVGNISQFRKIREHYYIDDFEKFRKQLYFSYSKAPFFSDVIDIFERILAQNDLNVAVLNAKTVTTVFKYLGIEKEFSFTSELSIPEDRRGQDRIIELCKKSNCTSYHNAIGGVSLYDADAFSNSGINLRFICSDDVIYQQGNNKNYIKNLSIIDALMWCSPAEVIGLLNSHHLIGNK